MLWEQTILPAATRGAALLSPVNLSPLAAGHAVVVVHDLASHVEPRWFTASGRFYGRLSLAGARRARSVVTVSDAVADELTRDGLDPDLVHVMRPAVSARFTPAATAAVDDVRRKHGLARDYVLFVGWADPRKDVATAVAASALVRPDLSHDLVLLGRAHPTFAPVQVPRDSGVRMLGFVDDDELVALLTGARALVYPTRYEGFGLPPLEAWACGTPALVSDLPVLRESTQGRATYLPAGDVPAWAEGVRAALRGELPVPTPVAWTWDDAAAQLIDAIAAAAPGGVVST
jgi:glycosyltransferase involved in cell wall biosynthesis